MKFKITKDMEYELASIDVQIDAFRSEYTQVNNIAILTYGELSAAIDLSLDEIEAPQDISSLDELNEMLSAIHKVFRQDNYGESLPEQYKHLIGELMK